LIIKFYSNEHEPIHVHGKCQGRESRAELVIVDGKITTINYTTSSGKAPLATNELAYFKESVTAKADDIVKNGTIILCCTSRYMQSKSKGDLNDI